MLLLVALLSLGALASDEEVIDPVTGLPDARLLNIDDEDDLDIAMPPEPEPVKVGPPVLALDPGTAEPLTAAFPASIAAVGPGVVVVELPVYVAKAPRTPEPGLMVIGEFMVGTTKVGEVRQILDASSMSASGPTFTFLKAVVPAATPTGTVVVVVKTAAKDGKSPKEAYRTSIDWTLSAQRSHAP